MYRIYDFHSKKAPKLKNISIGMPSMFGAVSFNFEQDTNGEEEDEPNPDVYLKFFSVELGSEKIYIEDPTEINNCGWTPLHTCCMSFSTVPAGIKLIDEYLNRGFTLDSKTYNGPGSFNRDWTALHMACAYGVEPLVLKLLNGGADPTCQNCYGYTPLLEACHRGFTNVVAMLLQHLSKSDLAYIPREELSNQSPFVSTPAQSALAEAARCGFPKIVQSLLDAGAPRDTANYLGWTALHEACFYNRVETVKTLLLGGVDSTVRTRGGALPYHLSGLAYVRTMLKDMGMEGSVPEKGDEIDMVSILRELTLPDMYGEGEEEDDENEMNELLNDSDFIMQHDTGVRAGREVKVSNEETPKKSPTNYKNQNRRDVNDEKQASPLLHSGPILGDLPALTSSGNKNANKELGEIVVSALDDEDGFGLANVNRELILNKNRLKKKGKKKKDKSTSGSSISHHRDMPPEFLCELSKNPMSDPVETIYGNMFEKSVIMEWLKQQGHICPISGGPLSENDIQPASDLRVRISKWLLQKSMESDTLDPNAESSDKNTSIASNKRVSPKKVMDAKNDDDLYDF